MYPHLDALLGVYFHQDFDLFGSTLAEIIATYAEDTSAEERAPEETGEALQRVFKPGVIIAGWEGLNPREWLERIAQLLEATLL